MIIGSLIVQKGSALRIGESSHEIKVVLIRQLLALITTSPLGSFI